MSSPVTDDDLIDWILGELDVAAADHVAKAVAENPVLHRRAEALRGARDQLGAWRTWRIDQAAARFNGTFRDRRRSPLQIRYGVAAVCIAAALGIVLHQFSQQDSPAPLTDRLAWTSSVASEHPNRNPQPNHLAFLDQFSFSFHIPESLPGDYRLLTTEAVEPSRAALIYARNDDRLLIFLSYEPGPDTPLESVAVTGRTLRTLRQDGLRVAALVPEGFPLDSRSLLSMFRPKSNPR